MARKKPSKESRNQPQERESPRDLSPVEKPQSLIETKSLEDLNKNLKTLNQMLAKETMENRFQIESLKSELEEAPLLFDIERGVYRLVVSSAVSEEKAAAAEAERKLGARVRVLEEEMETAAFERDEMERKAMKSGEAFDSLKEMMEEEMERNVEKVLALEGELRDAVEIARALRLEVVDLKRKNGGLEVEADGLREKEQRLEMHTRELGSKLDELGESVEKFQLEKEKLASNIIILEKMNGDIEGYVNGLEREKEEEKMHFEGKLRVYASELGDLRERMGSIEREKGVIEQAKAIQEVELQELKKEVMKLNSSLSVLHELEKKNKELEGEINALLSNVSGLEKEKEEKDAILAAKIREFDDLRERMGAIVVEKDAIVRAKANQDVEIFELKNDVMKLSSSLSVLHELEKRNGELEGEVNGLRKEKEEKEMIVVAKIRELDDLRERMGAIVLEKDAIVQVKANQEVEILELKKDMMKLSSSLSVLHELEKRNGELEGEVNDLRKEKEEKEMIIVAKISELDDLRERIGAIMQAKANSDAEIHELKEEVMKLNSCLSQLQDSNTEYMETNTQLQEDRDVAWKECKDLQALVSEKEVLSEQKALLEKSLSAAQAKCRDMEGKVRAGEVASSKVLSLLKGTVEAMNGSVEAREIDVVDDDENVRRFLEELESIKTAHRTRVTRIEEMNRELKAMKSAVVDARKKRGSWMWLYPVTSTLVAAISLAYAAKAR